ncbi:hypothetical protein Q9Q99_05990 [Curtobacterium flaccumfaciens]|nr:hypothetical protein Q9Q99_05990 [Curtobacterium flaccumfaciens]
MPPVPSGYGCHDLAYCFAKAPLALAGVLNCSRKVCLNFPTSPSGAELAVAAVP